MESIGDWAARRAQRAQKLLAANPQLTARALSARKTQAVTDASPSSQAASAGPSTQGAGTSISTQGPAVRPSSHRPVTLKRKTRSDHDSKDATTRRTAEQPTRRWRF